MKKTLLIISAAALVLGTGPAVYADHNSDCKGAHGTVSAKTDNSITVNGKTYTVTDAAVTREGGTAAGLSAVKTGDKVCIETSSSSAREASRVTVLDKDHTAAASVGSDASATTRSRADSARSYAYEKMNQVEQKAHEKMCKGHHGTITDKTANTLTVDGKTYALKADTQVNKQEEPLLPKTVKVGDRVCYTTMKASDGSSQIAKLMAIDKDADTKVRVRENVSDDSDVKVKTGDSDVKIKASDDKLKVETDKEKIEVK